MKKNNKIMSLLLALAMIVSYILPVGGNLVYASESFYIQGVSATGGTLSDGDSFSISFDMIFNQPVEDGQTAQDDTSVQINAYAPQGPSVQKQIITEGDKIIGLWVTIGNLKYNGKGDSADITATYKGTSKSINVPLSVRETIDATEALAIVEGTTINVKAGETQKVTLKIKNTTSGKTKESSMVITPPTGEGADGFEIDPKTIKIPAMNPGETKSISFDVSVNKTVAQGLYDLNVRIGTKDNKVQLKVESSFRPPTLELSVSSKSVSSNSTEEITINVKNLGDIAAKNVELTIAQNEKIAIVGGSNIKYIQSVAPNATGSVTIQGKIIDKSASSIPLSIAIKYIDETGKEGTSNQYVYLTTEQASLSKGVEIQNIIGPTGTYKAGDEFTVKFTVYAPEDIKNVQIKVGGESIAPRSTSLFIIDAMKKGEKKQYTVQFSPTKDATTNSYLIGIEVSYPNDSSLTGTSQYTTVNINQPDKEEDDEDNKKGKPKVIIGEYKSEPVVVKAGEEFELELGFLNTNKTKSVHNLKANLTVKDVGEKDTGSVFTPVGASNTFFISDMAPGETVTKNITLYTIPSAVPKTYEITIEMEYEDAEGEAITATEKLGIPVEQVTSLEVAEIRIENAQVGMETYLYAPIYNTGKTDISNMKISIQGEGFDVQDGTKFIGNFQKGASETYEPTLIPNQAGPVAGTILIEYEDVTGVKQSMTHEFEMEVMDMMTSPDWGYPGGEEIPPVEEVPEPSKMPLIVGGIVGVVLAAGVTVVVLKKRKAKKDEFDIDED